uniref:Salicylic acid binding protein 2 n=1 Tax=Kalanchoe fedtschenkoi TaxID=63787 RepID=A0A7N0T9J4_KALFE
MHFGAEFMKQKFYQNSPTADLELASLLTRPRSCYMQDLSKGEKFTEESYGSVERVYVVCGEDLGMPKEFQYWMIENYGATTDVMLIPNADHSAMTSTPEEVVKCLLEAAGKYA